MNSSLDMQPIMLYSFAAFTHCMFATLQESYELMAIPEMKYSIPFVNGSLNRMISNVVMPLQNTVVAGAKAVILPSTKR